MSLTLKLGKEIPGNELAEVVENAMQEMEDFRFRSVTGRYFGEAKLQLGYLLMIYPDKLVEGGEPTVVMHLEEKKGKRILEVSRKNKAYRRYLNRESWVMFLPPALLLIPCINLMNFCKNKAAVNEKWGVNANEYVKVMYDDNIFVELDENKTYGELEFHINAFRPNYRDIIVRSLTDAHFQPLRPDFKRLCTSICRNLHIPDTIFGGNPYREEARISPVICGEQVLEGI
jgi:hypothetical protein